MANPYHDEQGRFCSKTKMRNSIARLETQGKVVEYFELRTEYEKISGETYVRPTRKTPGQKVPVAQAKVLYTKPAKPGLGKSTILVEPDTSSEPNKSELVTNAHIEEKGFSSQTASFVNSAQAKGAKVTIQDAEIIDNRMSSAHGKGYGDGVNHEWHGVAPAGYDSSRDYYEIVESVSFEIDDDRELESQLKAGLRDSYEQGSGEGAWDV
jgi:hypothetical protein